MSDPFAKLSCGKESFQTEVCPKTLNPVWNKTRSYEFGSKQNLETVDGGNICVKIYDHNSIQANVLLGEVDLPFDDLWDNQGRTFVYDRPVLRGGAECGR